MARKRRRKPIYKNIRPLLPEQNNEYKIEAWLRIAAIIMVVLAILSILVIALDNRIVGYDHFIGIPQEWIRTVGGD
jgi:hypothetical protein